MDANHTIFEFIVFLKNKGFKYSYDKGEQFNALAAAFGLERDFVVEYWPKIKRAMMQNDVMDNDVKVYEDEDNVWVAEKGKEKAFGKSREEAINNLKKSNIIKSIVKTASFAKTAEFAPPEGTCDCDVCKRLYGSKNDLDKIFYNC